MKGNGIMKKRNIISIVLVMATISLITGCKKENSEKNNNETTKNTITNETIVVNKSATGNPILGFNDKNKLTYSGDPAALVDGDTVYLYTGHDTAPNESYVIPEWQCYSSKDMINWTYEGVVLKCSNIGWADNNSAWAGQVIKHYDKESDKDRYYFYFCSWNNEDNGRQSIGVAVSDNPTGPFTDIGHALVKGSFTEDETSAWNDIDPTVWIETDDKGEEHRYLCWGNNKVYMCELNEDMISIKDYDGDGSITFGKDVISKKCPDSFTEAPWIYRRQDENGKYYGDYYLFYAYSWREQMAYATTDNLMEGDFKFGSIIMEPTATSNTNHPSIIDFKGETYFIYHNGSLPKGSGFRRVVCAEKLVFNEDGTIPYIKETATGISGIVSTIKDKSGDLLSHEKFSNSVSDSNYPYTGVGVGTKLTGIDEDDSLWQIVQGKSDAKDETLVSIESYNKPGLYLTVTTKRINLSQDNTGTMATAQTFRTVKGLSGEGVSFESVRYKGQYITVKKGILTLSDGEDRDACTFYID